MTQIFVLRPYMRNAHKIQRNPQQGLDEAVALAKSINLLIAHARVINIKKINPASLFGRGTTVSLAKEIAAQKIDLVVIDSKLSPSQQRNLETRWKCKVIDRTGLILEIFRDRAHTHEGSLQVELAALDYQRSRLVRAWTHLERQRGGRGFLGGPGESQIEADRRHIDQRRRQIRLNLDKVVQTRNLQRIPRKKIPLPLVALVGYTNAGKSTLFNLLTQSNSHAANQLFATLDPKMRKIVLPSGSSVVLSDTVGFISDIPTELIAAFRATLEELLHATILLHIRDFPNPDTLNQKRDVQATLEQLSLSNDNGPIVIEVLNKIDLLDQNERNSLLLINNKRKKQIAISSKTGIGCESLLQALDEVISEKHDIFDIRIPATDGSTLAWLYRNGTVLSRRDSSMDVLLKVSMTPTLKARFRSNFGRL